MRQKHLILAFAIVCATAGFMFFKLPPVQLTPQVKTTRSFGADISTTIPGKTVTWKDKQFLMHVLNEIGFWDNNKIYLKPDGQPVSVDHVSIVISDRNTGVYELKRQKNEDQVVLSSYALEFNKNDRELRIIQYVNVDEFRPKSLEPITLEKQYGLAVLHTVFQLRVTPELSNTPDKLMERLNSYDYTFFTFSRNDVLFSLQ